MHLAFLASALALVSSGAGKDSPLGRPIEAFQATDFRGGKHALSDWKDKKLVVVAFLGVECPLAKLYAPRLVELSREFGPKGVAFVGVDSNQQDSLAKLAHYARTHAIEFPLLKDAGSGIADQFSAMRTPEVFVLDAERKIRYRGRIDDQWGIGFIRKEPTRRDLAVALEELLAGKEVSQPELAAQGCLIGRVAKAKKASDITYSKEVARIFQNRCVECHRAGEVAPFAMTSYQEVAGWAPMIQEVVENRRMPPWHADPAYGKFRNDCRLSDDEVKTIRDWVAAGIPEGDPKDLPPAKEYLKGWRIPTPELVLSMPREYSVPPTGDVQYQYFVVDPGFKEDKYIRFAELRPGNAAVVHHIIMLVRSPSQRAGNFRQGEGGSEWLVATAPGTPPLALPEGYAKKVPAGSKLIFQMHYTPNGSPQKDRSSVGFVFADPKEVRHEVRTKMAINQRGLKIPPHADNHSVEARYTFRRDALLLSMVPHMHLRGKAFRFDAIFPDGKRETLLNVPQYDFAWQNTYTLVEPRKMPAGTVMHCVAHYDNSENNLSNPDPTATVRWGDQTYQEMMIGYFDATDVDPRPIESSPKVEQKPAPARPTMASQIPVTDPLRDLAKKSLTSEGDFEAFATAIGKGLPQADRICVTVVKEKMLEVAYACDRNDPEARPAPVGFKGATDRLTISSYADRQEPTLHADLSKAPGADLRAMSLRFRSSVHLPVVWQGKHATVNVWSRQPGAFPESVVESLRELVRSAADRGTAKEP